MTSSLRGDTLPRIVSSHHDPGHAEQGPGADCLQRALVPRSRFRQQLRPGVRLTVLKRKEDDDSTPCRLFCVRALGEGSEQ
jgi:hypothetical protein